MAAAEGPNIATDGLVLALDAANIKSFRGEPTTNYATSDPWTVGGINTNVTGTNEQGPILESKTWKFEKTGTSNQWNGWEGNYGVWNVMSGEYWTISYWYKTSNAAGLSNFEIGNIVVGDWTRSVNHSVISMQNSIIVDGKWHYNYTVILMNETYTGGIIADGPSWPYSTSAGILYINGLQWEKKDHATTFVNGTRGTTVATGGGWQDLSGNEKNGELVNNPIFDNSNLGNVVFDGINDNIVIGTSGSIGVTSDVSVFAWIKVSSSFPSGSRVGAIFSNYPASPHFTIEGYTSGSLRVWWNNGSPDFFSSGFDMRNNNWTYVGFVRNSNLNTITMYVNGIYNNSTTAGSNISPNYPFKIGDDFRNGTSPGVPFNGKISNIKMYNRALSATEILQNYNSIKSRFIKDGSTPEKAVSSISELRTVGITSDGPYWFSTSKQATPFQAFVKFNYIDGGDWALLLKVHKQSDLPSGSAYWTNTTLYNETDFHLTSNIWSKYASWNGIPFTRLMMVMTQGGTEKVPPIMIFDTSRTFAEAITLAGGATAANGQNNVVKCTSTDPVIATNATYWNMTMKSGTNFTDANGDEDVLQAYGISMWANNSTNSTTAEGLSSTGRAGAWIGCPMDEGGHIFNNDSNTGADSGFGFGATTGNPAKTTSAGYSEWTNTTSTNTLPGYVWIR